MRRLKLIGAFLCLLAAWMQFLSPVAAMSMEADGSPFAIICVKASKSADTSTGGGSQQVPASHHDHQHCSLCQAVFDAPPPAERPAFTAFDYPIASPLRWRLADLHMEATARHRSSQPRAPPRSI